MKRSPLPAFTPASPETPPDPAPFPYRDYLAARDAIAAELTHGPFYALILGASGTGKTSLARAIGRGLDRHQHQFLYLSTPRVSLLSIVRYFAQVLRVTPRRSSLETIKVLADALEAQPTHLIAWIDEAAGLPADTLAELRSMAEFNHEVAQVFTVVLSGPPELRQAIDAPTLFHLKRRFALQLTLEGLRRDELEPFLRHRFGSPDAARLVPGAHDELFERTHGLPALSDRVVRYVLKRVPRGPIDEEAIREALDACGL